MTSEAPTRDATPPRCVCCGYDLRGLSADDRCPECGTSVARSLHGERLSNADPSWLRSVERGQLLIGLGCVVYWAGLVVAIGLGAVSTTLNAGPMVQRIVSRGPSLAALVLVLVGVVGVTALDPRLSQVYQPLGIRRVARTSAVAALALVVVSIGLDGSGLVTTPVDAVVFWAFLGLFASAVVAVTFHIAHLADRIPLPRIARDARKAARRFAISLPAALVLLNGARWLDSLQPSHDILRALLTAAHAAGAVAVVVAFVYAIAMMSLWWNFRKVLQECRALAEANVAANP